MNYSYQREKILEYVLNSCEHPSVEVIYTNVRKALPNISLGTVYRNLAFLLEKGMIIKISMENSPERYDYICKEHSHIICTNCGQVMDFYYDFKLESLCREIKSQLKLDFLVSDIIIKGICENCEKQKNKEE